ncbi:MAG TPA: transposase [Anaeromyxobacteraceae bacterium]|nr:transposase [Anaeromyxobacteraceae bacterium]
MIRTADANVRFKTKTQAASDMIKRALEEDRLPRGTVLADVFYGRSGEFRNGIRADGPECIVGVHSDALVPIGTSDGGIEPIRVDKIANGMERGRFGWFTWREGSKEPLRSSLLSRE